MALRNYTPWLFREATTDSISSTSMAKRFQPPGSGLRLSGMELAAEVRGPFNQPSNHPWQQSQMRVPFSDEVQRQDDWYETRWKIPRHGPNIE